MLDVTVEYFGACRRATLYMIRGNLLETGLSTVVRAAYILSETRSGGGLFLGPLTQTSTMRRREGSVSFLAPFDQSFMPCFALLRIRAMDMTLFVEGDGHGSLWERPPTVRVQLRGLG